MANFGIGGNEVPQDANESILEIAENRTILAQKLTNNSPVKPEIIKGLTDVEKVFEHFKPTVKVNYEDENGSMNTEDLEFKNLGDFGIKGITNQSPFLQDLDTQKDQYQKIIKQLKTNKILKSAIEDAEAKGALIETIEDIIKELK